MSRHKLDPETSSTVDAGSMFDLLDLQPGQTLEFKSSSSTYWVTRTVLGALAHQDQVNWKDEIIGFAFQTDSQTLSKFAGYAPNKLVLGRYVTLNESYSLVFRGTSGYIVEFSILR